MQIFFILSIPLILAVGTFFVRRCKTLGCVNALGHGTVLLFSAKLFFEPQRYFLSCFNFFYLDALSVFFIFTVAVINFASAMYSIEYISRDVTQAVMSERKARLYYFLFNLFACSMFLVTVVNNLGILWVAVEMTTLVSAFLVGFYNNKQSIEAAWKYIIICSVGIIFALLGTILFSYALSFSAGIKSLNWTEMVSCAGKLDKNVLKIAFIFIVVGYGTKAGLAPMHTWLPDAHSQAIAPISALLSGVLLKIALYALLRFALIINRSVGSSYFSRLMIFLGLLSLGVAAVFALVQKDVKRLLAYSSIEHIGIICVGLGIGGQMGFYGALLHLFNHAVTKSLMFFGAGNIVSIYHRHTFNTIRGVIKTVPFTGIMLILGTFALAGFPPFALFVSEIIIIMAAFLKGYYVVVSLLLFFIVIIFGALIYYFSRSLFGKNPQGIPLTKESFSNKLAFIFLFVLMCLLGFSLPWQLQRGIFLAVEILRGA